MTYYEELGLACSASEEEIRRAYRKLARLLHPDTQQDEELRRICEQQMTRLNEIAAILGDPEQRREYDVRAGLAVDEPDEPVMSRTAAVWVWGAAGAVGIALMAWFFGANTMGGSAAAPAVTARTAAEARNTVEARPLVAPLKVVVRRMPVAKQRVEAADEPPAILPEPARSAPKPEVRSPAVTAVRAPEQISNPPRPARSYFAGTWFFSRDASERDASLYPPEMIELTITEANGVLHGKYWGRYKVTDRPISPVVAFAFTGPAAAGEKSELTWNGAGGAAGQIRLKPVTPVSMEVSWWATRMGGIDLTSGTALLIRTQER